MAAKSGQFTMGGTKKGQFFCGNQGNLADERVVRMNKRRELKSSQVYRNIQNVQKETAKDNSVT